MGTVNKPILLDETGKDIASAVREQTEALQSAIQAISVGGGGGGDDGYFPSNTDMTIADAEDYTSELSGGGYIMGYKVYDPATSTHLPLKHIVAIGYSGEHTMVTTIAADTFEEIIHIADRDEGFIELLLNGGSFGVLAPITIQGITIGMGCIKCVNATEKPLWFLAIIPDFASVAMPICGYY